MSTDIPPPTTQAEFVQQQRRRRADESAIVVMEISAAFARQGRTCDAADIAAAAQIYSALLTTEGKS
jgi:hypothetical protein